MHCLCVRFGCDLQVEIQVRKIYCINRAIPTLPINLEDAARSEAEFEKAEQVRLMHIMQIIWILFWGSARFCALFLVRLYDFVMVPVIEGWREACSCWSRYPLELQSYWSSDTRKSSNIPDPVPSRKRECLILYVLLLICYYTIHLCIVPHQIACYMICDLASKLALFFYRLKWIC